MRTGRDIIGLPVLLVCLLSLAFAAPSFGADKLLKIEKTVREEQTSEPGLVRHHCLTLTGNDRSLGDLQRATPWSLPSRALADDFDTTITCLVMRFNFQYEETDDPNTTGRGVMDLSRPFNIRENPLADSLMIDSLGYLIDPPPHDSLYFDAHLRALSLYWERISEGRVHLDWVIYPPGPDSVYTLPHPMSRYGRCSSYMDTIVQGLLDYATDCFTVVDNAHQVDPGHPDIDFSAYDAYFLFHAGSDRQSDLGFPETCSDLFTGYVRFGYDSAQGIDERPLVDGTYRIPNAIMMPETVIQDGRVSAMNAVMAHEFGHQLGLVDIYSTNGFLTQMGDFALMDNNGFGTGLEFSGFTSRVFGCVPVYPMAWSRAFLGFAEVEDFRSDSNDVRLVAAEAYGSDGLKVARVPISETEYYLLENRIPDLDGKETYICMDTSENNTSVIMGPCDAARRLTGEYDVLLPGDPTGGMLILHVDEAVAALDYNGNGINNFEDNQLQWWVAGEERRFVSLVEADGLVQFGGWYSSGYGKAEDMYRDDRNNAFTPYTVPRSIDNSGNNTRVCITDIRRDTLTGVANTTYVDSVMFFDLAFEHKADGFPVRAGRPSRWLSPVADDIDGAGMPELIVAADTVLSVMTSSGEDFMRSITGCDTITCPLFYDTAITSINRGSLDNPPGYYRVPVFAIVPTEITAGPVTGRFDSTTQEKLVAVGCYHPNLSSWGQVRLYAPADEDGDARADSAGLPLNTRGAPVALSFGEDLFVLTDRGYVYRQDSPGAVAADTFIVSGDVFLGVCLLDGSSLVVLSADTVNGTTSVHFIGDDVYSTVLDGLYVYGPVAVDMDSDGRTEIVAFTADGAGVYLTIDTDKAEPSFSILAERNTGYEITTNPVAGDVDFDGSPDIIIGGRNHVYAFNHQFVLATDFPIEIDDRYPNATVIASAVNAEIDRGGNPELIFPTSVGNFYSFGHEKTSLFPVSSGEQIGGFSGSSAVLLHDTTGGILCYLGGDGWLYGWEVDLDTTRVLWPMNGGDPGGSFALPPDRLPSRQTYAGRFSEEKFYNYPNPVREGSTTIRYFLGEEANNVSLNIYDLSGQRVTSLDGPTGGGMDNEVVWDCAGVTSGVYRCVIKVEFPSETTTAHTDIAIIQ